MPKKRRRTKIPTPAWEPARGALGRGILGRSPRFYATVGIVVLIFLALGTVGFAYWADYQAVRERPNSTAVQIDDTKYTLEYFADRLKMFVQQSGGPGNEAAQPQIAIPAVAELLVQETIVRRFASEKEVSATDDDIKSAITTRLGLTADDPNYDARFQEELSRSGLTEEEYKQMIEAAVLQGKIRQKLEEGLPATAESVHFRQILVSDELAADEIRQEVEGGADFAQLAAERSLDTTTKDTGGDAGWVPRGALDKTAEDTLFALEPGKVSTFPTQSGVFVFQVVEKEVAREIDQNQRPALAARELKKWVDEKRAQMKVQELVSQDEDKARWAIDHAYSVT